MVAAQLASKRVAGRELDDAWIARGGDFPEIRRANASDARAVGRIELRMIERIEEFTANL
jgi:hypothetical protein